MKACEDCPKADLFERIDGLLTSSEYGERDLGRLCARLLAEDDCDEPRRLVEGAPALCGLPGVDEVRVIVDTALPRLQQKQGAK